MRRSVRVTALLAIAALVVISFGVVSPVSSHFEDDSPMQGPYVDEVIYKVIANQDQRVLALQAGEIEMDHSNFDPIYLPSLTADPDISIHERVRNGFGHITINCAKYPLNISGFRRAFAFAYNKTKVTSEVFDGFNNEHDSLVPLPNGWCIEDQLDFHYYDARPDIGNQMLDDLGFAINATSGFRTAPDGSSFEIVVEYPAGGNSYGAYDVAVEALHSLHIDAYKQATDFNEYISGLDSHEDYDMVYYAANFYSNDVDWLAYEYWSEYANTPYQNPTNFVNYTYDSWRDQLLYGTSYADVYEAAAEMQKILHYNVPRLVVSEDIYIQGYRNDAFGGHIEDLLVGISSEWTLRKIHGLDGIVGGSVPIAIAEEPDSFNIFVTNSPNSKTILSNLWPSLYKYGPDVTPWPDIAESMLTETHSDNAAVRDGHTRFTVDIVQNATWSDGMPLTSQDVAFSFIYAFESAPYGNPAGTDIGDLVAAYDIPPYRAVIEFCTESYWHFSNFAFDYIIPYHIFNDETGIGYDGWHTWNPVYNPDDPNVNCGPFIFTDYEAGEFYSIGWNPNFHYGSDYHVIDEVPEPPPITSPTTSSTSPTDPATSSSSTTSGNNQFLVIEIDWSLSISYGIGGFSSVVIVYCLFLIIQHRRNLENIETRIS